MPGEKFRGVSRERSANFEHDPTGEDPNDIEQVESKVAKKYHH
jgi:hypothetical protein